MITDSTINYEIHSASIHDRHMLLSTYPRINIISFIYSTYVQMPLSHSSCADVKCQILQKQQQQRQKNENRPNGNRKSFDPKIATRMFG